MMNKCYAISPPKARKYGSRQRETRRFRGRAWIQSCRNFLIGRQIRQRRFTKSLAVNAVVGELSGGARDARSNDLVRGRLPVLRVESTTHFQFRSRCRRCDRAEAAGEAGAHLVRRVGGRAVF